MSTDIASRIDALMEQASRKLVNMEYLACERLCVEAVMLARESGDFQRLARIMLPLQESRRQRRQIAEDAGVIVLTGRKRSPKAILKDHNRGCLLLTDPPYSQTDADELRALARQRECFVEVLCLDRPGLTAAFCAAMEDAGDAALASIPDNADPVAQVDAILAQLDRIGDHEIAHQRLAEAARRAAGQRGG